MAFPSTTSTINDLVTPPTATRPNPLYDATQEADLEIGNLAFDNCTLYPRYLLLLKDIFGCTDKGDLEYPGLLAVHTLVFEM